MNHQAKVGSNSLPYRREKGVGRERENPQKKRERKLTLSLQILQIPYPFRYLPWSSQTNTCRLIRELKQRGRRLQRGREKKKAVGLDLQNNNFARANHAVLHISLLSLHDWLVIANWLPPASWGFKSCYVVFELFFSKYLSGVPVN